MSVQMTNFLGEKLYPQIRDAYDAVSVAACKEAGMYSPTVTAGRMTGMILEAHTEAEMRAILADPDRIAALMVQCVEAICAHEQRQAVQAVAKKATEKSAWGALVKR